MSFTKDSAAGVASAAAPYVILAAIIGAVWIFREQIFGFFTHSIAEPVTEAAAAAGNQFVENVIPVPTGTLVGNAEEVVRSAGTLSGLLGGPGNAIVAILDSIKPAAEVAGQTSYEFGGNITPWVASGETGHFQDVLAGFSPTITPFAPAETGGFAAAILAGEAPPVEESVPPAYVSPAESSGLLDSLRAAAQGWRNKVVFAGELPDLYTMETASERAAGVDILYRSATQEIGRTGHSWWITNLTGGPGSEAGNIGQPVSYAILNVLGY